MSSALVDFSPLFIFFIDFRLEDTVDVDICGARCLPKERKKKKATLDVSQSQATLPGDQWRASWRLVSGTPPVSSYLSSGGE